MRSLLLLPCLLATSCALFQPGEKAPKPGVVIFEAPGQPGQKKETTSGSEGATLVQGQGDSTAPLLPGNSKPGSKPLPGTDNGGYRMPDPLNTMPEDKDFRGSGQKTATNPGVIVTPPKQ